VPFFWKQKLPPSLLETNIANSATIWWLTKLIFPLSKTTLHTALSLSKGCTTTQTYQPHDVNGRVDGSEILHQFARIPSILWNQYLPSVG